MEKDRKQEKEQQQKEKWERRGGKAAGQSLLASQGSMGKDLEKVIEHKPLGVPWERTLQKSQNTLLRPRKEILCTLWAHPTPK